MAIPSGGRMKQFLALLAIAVACCAQDKAATPAPAAPAKDVTHFHHIHLNVTDPLENIKFYSTKFDAEPGKFAGAMDAVWSQKSWMLFTKVTTPPKTDITSGLWHFGWGAEDMKATYQKQLDAGT